MGQLLRGEIRWANIETAGQVVGHEQGNRRPALILSNEHFNAASQLVIVALIGSNSANRGRSTSLRIQSVQMPNNPSWVLPGQVRTLSAQSMGDLIGKMSDTEIMSVVRILFRLIN